MIKFLKLAVWVMLTEFIIGWGVEDFSGNFLKNGISGFVMYLLHKGLDLKQRKK